MPKRVPQRLTSDPERLKRAATETMTIRDVPDRWWVKIVETEHGTYTVNARARSCTCTDFTRRILKLRQAGDRDARCKHLLRVLYGERMLQASLLVAPVEPRKETA